MSTTDAPKIASTRTRSRGRRQIREAWSYIYVALWNIWFTLKVTLIGTFVALLVVLLSIVELLSPAIHLLEPDLALSSLKPWEQLLIHCTIATLLFFAAVILFWHHHRLSEKAKRYRSLLAFLMVLAADMGELTEPASESARKSRAVRTLDALVRAINRQEGSSKPKYPINASILVRSDLQDSPFEIYAQDSENAFRPDLVLPHRNSVAGKVVEFDNNCNDFGSLLYVPSTKYVHGIAFRTETVSGNDEVFTESEIIPTTYTAVDSTTEREVLKCLLCIQIPRQPGNGRNDSYPCAVLSLSAKKSNCMDSVFFIAAKSVSALLVQIM